MAHGWTAVGNRRLEVQLKRLTQIFESLFLGSTLAGYVDIKALRNEPLSLAPDPRRKRLLHEMILARSAAQRTQPFPWHFCPFS
jgi:hypothetical protein